MRRGAATTHPREPRGRAPAANYSSRQAPRRGAIGRRWGPGTTLPVVLRASPLVAAGGAAGAPSSGCRSIPGSGGGGR